MSGQDCIGTAKTAEDARLIASAPELLAALKQVNARLETVLRAQRFGQAQHFIDDSISTHPDLIVGRSAILKAEGGK